MPKLEKWMVERCENQAWRMRDWAVTELGNIRQGYNDLADTWDEIAAAIEDALERERSDIQGQRAKLHRVRDWLKYEANSEGGIVAEIDGVLAEDLPERKLSTLLDRMHEVYGDLASSGQHTRADVVNEAALAIEALETSRDWEAVKRDAEASRELSLKVVGQVRDCFHEDSEEWEQLTKALVLLKGANREKVGSLERYADSGVTPTAQDTLDTGGVEPGPGGGVAVEGGEPSDAERDCLPPMRD